jgi:predicted 3-demethylubiquinone-9 3-methyltransferase (glyoxalase superfamily)
VSWQIIPTVMIELMQSQDAKGYDSVMQAMLEMVKLDIKALEKAAYAHK